MAEDGCMSGGVVIHRYSLGMPSCRATSNSTNASTYGRMGCCGKATHRGTEGSGGTEEAAPGEVFVPKVSRVAQIV